MATATMQMRLYEDAKETCPDLGPDVPPLAKGAGALKKLQLVAAM